MKEHIYRLTHGCHHDPFQYLGVHFTDDGSKVTIRTFQPHAEAVRLLTDTKVTVMENMDDSYIFSVTLDRKWFSDPDLDPYTYQFEIDYTSGYRQKINDPYRFLPQLQELDSYLFNFGTNYQLYEHLEAT